MFLIKNCDNPVSHKQLSLILQQQIFVDEYGELNVI